MRLKRIGTSEHAATAETFGTEPFTMAWAFFGGILLLWNMDRFLWYMMQNYRPNYRVSNPHSWLKLAGGRVRTSHRPASLSPHRLHSSLSKFGAPALPHKTPLQWLLPWLQSYPCPRPVRCST
uniref:Uncharacterized protein n=1 Tax=Micrurus lemniscatus lemniscatus TaxID=129467 RepID=A0A2D4IR94_MICLE